jgi:ATP-dependent Clp protease ATP-binding subunit ClpC
LSRSAIPYWNSPPYEVQAQEEARALNHHYIGTEHILLALIREESVGRGQHGPPRGHIPITPPAKRTLELSVCEAVALGDTSIGTEHILLSLIRLAPGRQSLRDRPHAP